MIQTAVTQHNICKPKALLTAVSLFCLGQRIQFITFTFYFISLKCFCCTSHNMKMPNETRTKENTYSSDETRNPQGPAKLRCAAECVWVVCVTFLKYAVESDLLIQPVTLGVLTVQVSLSHRHETRALRHWLYRFFFYYKLTKSDFSVYLSLKQEVEDINVTLTKHFFYNWSYLVMSFWWKRIVMKILL